MQRAIYDSRPAPVGAVGNGNFLYRWDIREETVETQESGTRIQYSCLEVTVYEPVSFDKLVTAMIRQKYTADDELAMARQCYAEVEEYKAYNAYVEDCKKVASGFLGREYKPSFMPTQSEVMSQLRTLAKGTVDNLPDAEAVNVPSLFEAWQPDIDSVKDERRYFGGSLYKCVQAHKTQAGWEPDKTPALWVRVSTEEWPEWAQPAGAHDAYAKGDKTAHNGKHWTSDVDANVWEPGVYGWSEAA